MENSIWFPLFSHMLRYVVFAGIPFLIWYVFFPGYFSNSKIQRRKPKGKDFRREVLHSLQTIAVITAIAGLILFTPLRDWSLFYELPGEYPWYWTLLSILLAIIIHDTYFYWLHRLIHHPRLFHPVHSVHHQSHNPTSLAAYSFNLLEGILESLVVVLILFVIPTNVITVLVYGLLGFLFNVYGHLGHEIAPRWFQKSFLFRIFTTSVYHNMHHARGRYNYGLYFRFWDMVMGTESPQYEEKFEEVQRRRFPEDPHDENLTGMAA